MHTQETYVRNVTIQACTDFLFSFVLCSHAYMLMLDRFGFIYIWSVYYCCLEGSLFTPLGVVTVGTSYCMHGTLSKTCMKSLSSVHLETQLLMYCTRHNLNKERGYHIQPPVTNVPMVHEPVPFCEN